jgi:hypothetical protein
MTNPLISATVKTIHQQTPCDKEQINESNNNL